MDSNRIHECSVVIQAIARDAENLARHLRNLGDLLSVSTGEVEEELNENKKRKRTKLVDPEEPEKPQGAYNYFIKRNFPAIRKKFPNENKKIMTELAALWKKTSFEDRKQYEDLADHDKKRYEIEKQKFEAYRMDHPFDAAKEGVTINAKRLQRKQVEADTSPSNHILEKKELDCINDDYSSSSSSSSAASSTSDEFSDGDHSESDEHERSSMNKSTDNGQ
ncbi:hypothetical protein INT45_000489 [Circinella minor]|uniref:HMG box domain-containing protein n=1 Tax=Circinella minor TaxID=1195481 RepID=A0A8H7S517_9FUNG|nr:hypothetical protein INT45_000489 [Circinella minor]